MEQMRSTPDFMDMLYLLLLKERMKMEEDPAGREGMYERIYKGIRLCFRSEEERENGFIFKKGKS